MHFEQASAEELLGPLNDVEKKYAPARLFIAGSPLLLRSGSRVSIVGSRKASRAGLERTHWLARSLATQGAIVVSGLAEGIDTAAHSAAIESGGKTIAVLGTPLDESFPASNRDLQALIMREHLAISQFASGTAVHKGNFPMRNRTMALISNATVIVEAGEKSGTVHQGWEALRLGRPLFLMDTLLEEAKAGWPEEMMGYGAHLLTTSALEELREFLPERPGAEVAPFTH